MSDVSVHIYKHSQESRRKILKKLWLQGFIIFIGKSNKHYVYKIPNEVGMLEYRKRFKLIKQSDKRIYGELL